MRSKFLVFAFSALMLSLPIIAEEIDENAMFSDTETVVESKTIVNNNTITEEEKKSLSLSGDINISTSYDMAKEWFANEKSSDKEGFDYNRFSNSIIGNLILDARLKKGIKGYGNLEIEYNPSGIMGNSDSNKKGIEDINYTKYSLKEFFVDINYDRKVYFRFGKQVLQWGTGYFWNPTDLINIEKKKIVQSASFREGTYGAKMHIPFGTAMNIYGFVDGNNLDNIDEPAVAGKIDFLLGNVELSASAWTKKNKRSVFGIDGTTKLFDIDFRGESSFSNGSDKNRVKLENGNIFLDKPLEGIIPKVCIGFTRNFKVNDEKDKISLTGEFYYNHEGYESDIWSDRNEYMNKTETTVSAIDIYSFMAKNGLAESNSIAKYYGAMFVTVSKFPTKETTYTLNAIGNIVDGTFLIANSIDYVDINDLKLGVSINGYLGQKYGEYTAFSPVVQTRLTAGISF